MIAKLSQKLKNFLSRWIYPNGFFRVRGKEPVDRLGQAGEQAAATYLRRQGYRIVAHGHRQRLGEIDLIAVDGRTLVFVEVKTWQSDSLADPSEAVDRNKQAKLTRAALFYLKEKRLLEHPARFDVVSVVWPESARSARQPPQVRHFKNAFEAVGRGQFFS